MKACAAALALAVLSACAALPPPPLHAAWYLQYTPGDAQSTAQDEGVSAEAGGSVAGRKGGYRLYVALLNRSGSDIAVDEVIVNPGTDAAEAAWCWVAADHGAAQELMLPVGKLVTLRFDEFALKSENGRHGGYSGQEGAMGGDGSRSEQHCILSVEIAVRAKADDRPWHERWYGRAQGDSSGVIRAELAGRMPSSLPDDWAEGCRPKSVK